MPVAATSSIPETIDSSLNVDQVFQKKLPYKLIPTNLAGVYTSAAPPSEFDPRSADSKELLRYGLFLRRPSEGTDSPAVVAAWEKAFSRKWLPQDRIVPQLVPQLGVTHRLRRAVKTDGSYTNNNWGGAVVKGPWISAVGRRLELQFLGRNRRRQHD